jgi:hypothetical protein
MSTERYVLNETLAQTWVSHSMISNVGTDGSVSARAGMGDFSFMKSVIFRYLLFLRKTVKFSLHGATSSLSTLLNSELLSIMRCYPRTV